MSDEMPVGNLGRLGAGSHFSFADDLKATFNDLGQKEMVAHAIEVAAAQIAQLQPGEWFRIERNDPAKDPQKGFFTVTINKKDQPEGG